MNKRLMLKGYPIEESSFRGKCLKNCSREELLEIIVWLRKEREQMIEDVKHRREMFEIFE